MLQPFALGQAQDAQALKLSAPASKTNDELPKGALLRLKPPDGANHEVGGVAFSPDGRLLASLQRKDLTVHVWEVSTGRLRCTWRSDQLSEWGLAFSRDSKSVLAGTSDSITSIDVGTGRDNGQYALNGEGNSDHRVPIMYLAEDGKTVFAVCQSGHDLLRDEDRWAMHAWDNATKKHLRTFALSGESIYGLYSRFSGDGRLILLPNGSGYDTTTGIKAFHLKADSLVLAPPVGFSPDRAFVAVALQQKLPAANEQRRTTIAIQVWELATLRPVVRLKTNEVAHLAFTPDGRHLLTVGMESIQCWDLVSAKEGLRRLYSGANCHFGPSFACSFALAPNGKTAATGLSDGTVLIWDVAPPATKPHAEKLTGAELDACGSELSGEDARRALAAQTTLIDAPDQSVAYLQKRLSPAAPPPGIDIRPLIAALDADSYKTREDATNKLISLGMRIERDVQEALRANRTLEATKRLKRIFARLHTTAFGNLSPEDLRAVRSVRVLEWAGTGEAVAFLKKLASGDPDAKQTQHAKAALARCRRRAETAR